MREEDNREGKLSTRDELRGGYIYGVGGVAYPSSPPLPSKAGSQDEIVLPITDSPAGPALAPWPTASKLFPPFLGSLTGFFLQQRSCTNAPCEGFRRK